jgi:hypothetical protein
MLLVGMETTSEFGKKKQARQDMGITVSTDAMFKAYCFPIAKICDGNGKK